jgi:hypothetical protein
MVGVDYGWRGIGFEACTHLPIAREFFYWRGHFDIDRAWVDQRPFCSMAQSLWWEAGGVDPVPGRAPQLTTPADTYCSLLCSPHKIALIP